MGSNKTTISVTIATGELKLIHTLKQRVSNNKHPPYKYANQADLLVWVGSRPPTNGSDSLLIMDEFSKMKAASRLNKTKHKPKHDSCFEAPLRIHVRMSGSTVPRCAIASNLCDLFAVHFRAFD